MELVKKLETIGSSSGKTSKPASISACREIKSTD